VADLYPGPLVGNKNAGGVKIHSGATANELTEGCMMATAKEGNTVKVHYTGTLEDGTVFDSSQGRDPLEFTIGESEVIPGFEQAVVGMSPGESKTITIPADDAYGPHYEEMVAVVDREQFPQGMPLSLNQQLELGSPDGQTIVVRIVGLSGDNVTLDANHPLAGQNLTFDLLLVEVES